MPATRTARTRPRAGLDTLGPEAGPAPDSAALAAGAETLPAEAETICLDAAWLGELASTEGLFVTDERQRIRAWSPAAERLLGRTADEVRGQTCYQILMGRHPEGHPVCSPSCPVTRNARRGRGTAAYEVTTQASDGSTRYLTNNVLVMRGPRGAFRVIHMLHESPDKPPSRPSDVAAPNDDLAAAEPLTRRELEVLRLFARGLGLAEISAALDISLFTVRNHATTIQHKLGVRNRLAMVLEGMRRGLV
jgi:PAS domain S-box-containing protein